MMSSFPRAVWALAASASLVLACIGVEASDRDEHAATVDPRQLVTESPVGLPFAVVGTMTAPPTKFAVISMTGLQGQVLAKEGAVVAQYRVVSIHADRVVFESEGHTFFVRVGTEHEVTATPTPTTPSVRRRTAPLTVVAPPANSEEIRRQTGAFVERLKANPEFQKGLDERLRRIRERDGASQPPNQP
jgi:hypothetical protein